MTTETGADFTRMTLDAIVGYIRDRLNANNYAEAARASMALAMRLDPETTADQIVLAHVAGQRAGAKRAELALQELFDACIGMEASIQPNQDHRTDEGEYRAAIRRAADALGVKLPAALQAEWEVA